MSATPLSEPSTDVRIVLVGTSHPGNIGSTARAMKTMALRRLVLAEPDCEPESEDAWAMAAGAHDLIVAADRHPSLADAIADCTLVLGCTARRRSVPLPELDPRQAAAHALATAGAGGRVAILFGRERIGLTNDELKRCHAAVHVPTDPEFGSLNVASAVQIMAYELRMASLGPTPAEPVAVPAHDRTEPPATVDQLERFFVHLDEALNDIDFHKGRAADIVMQRLRRLYLRAQPDERELRILRGILSEAQRMARLAGPEARSDRKREGQG